MYIANNIAYQGWREHTEMLFLSRTVVDITPLIHSQDDQTDIKSTSSSWTSYQLLLAYETKLASSQ
jgi:hypothetical protein